MNDLFEGDLPDDDKLVYVSNVIAGKRLESGILVQQAANNTKERLATSPDLDQEVLSAIMSKPSIPNGCARGSRISSSGRGRCMRPCGRRRAKRGNLRTPPP